MKISNVQALEILDSRGNPTIRAVVKLEDGSKHYSSVSSGASTGSFEAVELRDNDSGRYSGKGVLKAVENVNNIIRGAVVGKNADPKEIDKLLIALDGTETKEKLGANAILSVSMAVTRAAAHSANQPLWKYLNEYFFKNEPKFPRLMVNVVNGGRHASWNFDIQEFMIVPNSNIPSKAVQTASEIFHSLGSVLKNRDLSTLVGDEGGYSPKLESNEEALNTIVESAKNAGYENVKDYRLSLDCAASEFFSNGNYTLENKKLTASELFSYYMLLATRYQLLSIEDPFAEDDWEAWKKFNPSEGDKRGGTPIEHPQGSEADRGLSDGGGAMAGPFEGLVIIGDDLFCTNPVRIKRGIEEKAANGVLIKLNQIGTVTETVEAINLAQTANWPARHASQLAGVAGWKVAISHRSGETEDAFIADLAYACAADFLKAGSMSRSERLSKYNRLLEIEANL